MALRCFHISFDNQWLPKAIFHAAGSGPESGGETHVDIYEAYKKASIDALKDPEQKAVLTKIVDKAKENKIPIQTLTVVLQPLVDTLNGSEKFSEAGKAEINAKLKEITQDGVLSGAEVREIIDLRFKEERRMLIAEMEDTQLQDSYIYLKKATGVRIEKSTKDREFAVKDKYMIDFGIGEEGVNQDKAKAAQNFTRLDHMVPTEVTQVEVVSVHNKETVDLVRYSDGKFREVGKKLTDKWYPVYQNDTVTVLNRGDLAEKAAKKAEQEAEKAKKTAEDAKAKEEMERTKDAEKRAQDLTDQDHEYYIEGHQMTKETIVKLPDEFLNKSGDQIQELLPRMEYGEQLKEALTQLSEIQGKKMSPIGLLENIRTKELASRNKVGFGEITKEVLGMTPEQTKAEQVRLTQLTSPTSAETARLEQLRSFYSTAAKLMNALRNMKTIDYSVGGDIAPEDQTMDESILDLEDTVSLFFDAKKEGPVADPTLWQGIRGQDRHEITMDYSENRAYGPKASEFRNYSEAAAWENIRNQGLVYKDGVASYDPQRLVDALNKYLFLGKIKNATGADYEKMSAIPPLLTTDLSELRRNPDLQLYKKAIQMGFAQSLETGNSVPETNPVAEISDTLAAAAKLSPEEKAEAQSKLKEYQILTLGALVNTGEASATEFGADVAVPLTKDGRLVVHAGLRDNVYHQVLELHVGPSVQILRSDRVTLTASAGIDANPKGSTQLGAGLGMDIGLGKEGTEHTFNIDVGISAGLNPRNAALALGAYLGVSRDLQAVLARKTEKIVEGSAKNIEEALRFYQTSLQEAGYTPDQQKSMMAQMERSIKESAGAQGIDDMNQVQFGAAGLALVFVPGLNAVVPVPYLNVMLKGDPYAVYETAGVNLDAAAKQQLESACRKQLGEKTIQAYESGSLMESADGGRKIGSTSTDVDLKEPRLASLNEALGTQGLQVEMDAEGKLKLQVSNARGNVDIYTDPGSGIQTYTEHGNVYLNLDSADHLAVKRIDEWSMFKRDNAYQNVKIYISNTLAADPETIRETTDKHIHFENLRKNVYSGATEIRDQGAYTKMTETGDQGQDVATGRAEAATTHLSDRSTFGSEEALNEAGLKTLMMSEDYADRATALKEIREVIRIKGTGEVSAETSTAIDAAVDRIMADDATRLSYKELSTELSKEDLVTLLRTSAPELNINDEAVLTVTLQRLMEASLSTNDKDDPKKLDAMIAWNKKRVTQNLQSEYGFDEASADRIASRWMEKWSDPAQLTPTAIPNGAWVGIEVGTEGVNGTRNTTWTEGGNLLGAIDLRSDPDLAQRLTSEALETIEDNPFQLQLATALLDRSDLLFTSEEMHSLKTMAQGGEINKPVYDKFTNILRALYIKGNWTSPDGSTTIHASLSDQVGLYEKCLNFTEVAKNTISIDVKVPESAAVGTQTREFLKARANVEFIGLGVAAGVRVPEEKTPPPGEGSKDGTGSASTDPVTGSNTPDPDPHTSNGEDAPAF